MAALPKTASPVQFNESLTLTVSAINANSFMVETYTVNGIDVDNFVLAYTPTGTTGVKIIAARASANNTLELTWLNATSASAAMGSTVVNIVAL